MITHPFKVLVIPWENCVWAEVPAEDRLAFGKIRDRSDRYLAEEALRDRLPIPMDLILFDSVPTPENTLIVCGVPKVLLDGEARTASAAHPDTLPPFFASRAVDPRYFNLVDHRSLPRSRAMITRMWRATAICALIVIVATTIAIVRRASFHRDQTRSLRLEAMEALTGHEVKELRDASTTEIKSLIALGETELLSLRKVRLDRAAAAPDGLSILQLVGPTLGNTNGIDIRSLRITPTRLEVSLSAIDRARASDLASALAAGLGWSTSPLSEGSDEGHAEVGRRTFSAVVQPSGLADTVQERRP